MCGGEGGGLKGVGGRWRSKVETWVELMHGKSKGRATSANVGGGVEVEGGAKVV
jgi:hypothetical protein